MSEHDTEFVQRAAELADRSSDATVILKSMSNEARLGILCNLAQGEKSVGELQALLGLTQSALSQHLAVLRRDGIVDARREAQSVIYCIASEAAKAIMITLSVYLCGNDET